MSEISEFYSMGVYIIARYYSKFLGFFKEKLCRLLLDSLLAEWIKGENLREKILHNYMIIIKAKRITKMQMVAIARSAHMAPSNPTREFCDCILCSRLIENPLERYLVSAYPGRWSLTLVRPLDSCRYIF